MEIKSSLINSKEMEFVKNSLIKISEIDHEEKFRVNMLEYINDVSDDSDDEFFFDMLEYVRFLNPSVNDVAYTDRNHLIWMNAPSGGNGLIGKNVRQWDFVYDHECLHQLWDTFGVGDKIKEEGKEYDHYVLNIASDCVINDYLSFYRKKPEPNELINPAYLKENFGVEYDRKKDTQYTLYLKLLKVKDKLKDDERCQQSQDNGGDAEGQSGQGNGQEGQSSQSGQGGQSNQNESAQDAADRAEKAAQNAQDAANKAKDNNEEGASDKQNAANEAKEAAKEAKEAANKAKEAAKNGDKEEEEKQTKKAKEAADRAEKAAKEAGAKESGKGQGNGKGGKDKGEKNGQNSGEGKGQGNEKATDNTETEADLAEIRKNAENVINKYKEKIGGDLGKFIKQCKMSKALKNDGLVVQTQKGVSMWNKQLQMACNSYIKMKVFKKQREFKRTYQRVKRGHGLVEFGEPLIKGKKLKDDKLVINVAFYIDRSGSMSGCIKDVFNAVYRIADSLKRLFGKEKVVEKTEFAMYVFDTDMAKLNWGKTISAAGGTMNFDDLLKRIVKETNNYMINIIITDAEFEVNEKEVNEFLKSVEGFVIFITNNTGSEVKDIAKHPQNKTKLLYIQADSNFTTN